MYLYFEFAKPKMKKKPNKNTHKIHDYEYYISGRYIDYISRPSAVYIQNDNDNRTTLLAEMDSKKLNVNLFMNSKLLMKQLSESIDRYGLKEGSKKLEGKTGLHKLFEKDLIDIDPDEAKKEFKKLENNNQFIWEMTLNPGQLGIDNQMVDKNEWNEILNKHMKSLLKANKLDPNKIEGYWALHANSKYPHIHLGFFEKETNHNNNFRPSGKFSSKSVERFKYLFENSIKTQAEYQNLFNLKNSIWNNRKEIKELFLSAIALNNRQEAKSYEALNENELKILNASLVISNFYKNSKSKSYAAAKDNLEVKEAINDIYEAIVENNPKLGLTITKYKQEFESISNAKFSNKYSAGLKDEFVANEKDEFEKQIGNIIVKQCLKMNANEKEEDKKISYKEKDLKEDFNEAKLPIGLSFYPNKYDEISKLKRMIWSLNYEFNRLSRSQKFQALRKYKKNISEVKSKVIL